MDRDWGVGLDSEVGFGGVALLRSCLHIYTWRQSLVVAAIEDLGRTGFFELGDIGTSDSAFETSTAVVEYIHIGNSQRLGFYSFCCSLSV